MREKETDLIKFDQNNEERDDEMTVVSTFHLTYDQIGQSKILTQDKFSQVIPRGKVQSKLGLQLTVSYWQLHENYSSEQPSEFLNYLKNNLPLF